jgi:protein TonB
MALGLAPSLDSRLTRGAGTAPESGGRKQRLRRLAWFASALLHAVVLALLLGLWRSPHVDEFPPIEVALVPGTGDAGTAGGSGGGATQQGALAQGSEEPTPNRAADAAPPESPPKEAVEAQPVPPAPEPQPTTATTTTPTLNRADDAAPPVSPPKEAVEAQPVPPAPEPQPTETPPAPPTPPQPTTATTTTPAPAKPLEPIPPPPRKPRPPQPTAVAAAPPPPLPAKPTPQPSPSPAPLPQVAMAPVPQPTPGTPGTGTGRGGPGGVGQGEAGAGHGIIGNGSGPGDDYLERVWRHVRRFVRYPEVEKKGKKEGTGRVMYRIGRDGTVLEAAITESTGYPALDQAILDALHRASPVPPPPSDYPGTDVQVDSPFDFHLGFFDRVFD